MGHNKINFESRSEETRTILKNISGKGLRWGIYALVVLFFIVIVMGSTVKFPTYYPVTTELVSSSKMKITNIEKHDDFDFQSIQSVMIGKEVVPCNLELKKNEEIEINFDKDLIDDTVFESENVHLIGTQNVFYIIFNNIL